MIELSHYCDARTAEPPARPSSAGAFAAKLRMTAILLGCSSRKELCRRFHIVNPRTEYDLERSYKWMQGRALPRSRGIYEDWAKLLGISRGPEWLAACSPEAFMAEVCQHFDADAETLGIRAGPNWPDPGVTARPTVQPIRPQLPGTYLCYSHAWSPYFRDRLVRGVLSVVAAGEAPATASYTENLASGQLEFTGEVHVTGATLSVWLRDAVPGSMHVPVALNLFVPGPPGSVMLGTMAGATAIGPEACPSTSRLVALRVPAAAAGNLAARSPYLAATSAALAEDLAELPLGLEAPDAAAKLLLRTLAGPDKRGLIQVTWPEQVELAACFDARMVDRPGVGAGKRWASPLPSTRVEAINPAGVAR